jgi:hypothetical protein
MIAVHARVIQNAASDIDRSIRERRAADILRGSRELGSGPSSY